MHEVFTCKSSLSRSKSLSTRVWGMTRRESAAGTEGGAAEVGTLRGSEPAGVELNSLLFLCPVNRCGKVSHPGPGSEPRRGAAAEEEAAGSPCPPRGLASSCSGGSGTRSWPGLGSRREAGPAALSRGRTGSVAAGSGAPAPGFALWRRGRGASCSFWSCPGPSPGTSHLVWLSLGRLLDFLHLKL